MSKKMYFLTLDTETATLPFINDFAESERKKIAIAKPLVYDIGWIITDRKGNTIIKKNYLVQETFFVPSIFNTAYYKDKRPIYINLLKDNQIDVSNWKEIIVDLKNDIKTYNISAVTAYNACFDFKKAIPFTNRYIKNLYSTNYANWEKEQHKKCEDIIAGKKSNNPEYLIPIFELEELKIPIIDIWNVACTNIINHNKYKTFCLQNNLWSNSVQYFSSSAENVYRYLKKDADFIESHTALDDATIEAEILTKALKKGKVDPQIKEFPFRNLGTTIDFVREEKNSKYREKLLNALTEYYNNGIEQKEKNGYWRRVENLIIELTTLL